MTLPKFLLTVPLFQNYLGITGDLFVRAEDDCPPAVGEGRLGVAEANRALCPPWLSRLFLGYCGVDRPLCRSIVDKSSNHFVWIIAGTTSSVGRVEAPLLESKPIFFFASMSETI